MPSTRPCAHAGIQFDVSAHAEVAGFHRPNHDRRLAATTRSGRNPLVIKSLGKGIGSRALQSDTNRAALELAPAFPGPLVLPGDHLSIDPRDPPQSFRSWHLETHRNKPTKKRQTLYVAAVPEITARMRHMHAWLAPNDGKAMRRKDPKITTDGLRPLRVDDYVEYLAGFYHGMEVKPLPEQLKFIPWSGKGTAHEKYVGLAIGKNCTRVRTRSSPDGLFSGQLNLEDILDAAIEMLPADAYAIVLLTDHDLYEDEEDDFCCGRAYGGSRVCVVSSARYNPDLDAHENIDPAHMWPASHCKTYVDHLCDEENVESLVEAPRQQQLQASPLSHAIGAASAIKLQMTASAQRGLLFSRLARTVAHELGHCFGMGHCSYYACSMQGTAGMTEDVRQPPYLCPVCLGKVTHAIALELHDGDEGQKDSYIIDRYKALLDVCNKWCDVGMFAGYAAWLQSRLAILQAD